MAKKNRKNKGTVVENNDQQIQETKVKKRVNLKTALGFGVGFLTAAVVGVGATLVERRRWKDLDDYVNSCGDAGEPATDEDDSDEVDETDDNE